MSRTRHVTADGKRPHRQRATVRLTKALPGEPYSPYAQRPKNEGTSRTPGGGYAADRVAHASAKKHGRRKQRARARQELRRTTAA